jgi:hypothetical protein
MFQRIGVLLLAVIIWSLLSGTRGTIRNSGLAPASSPPAEAIVGRPLTPTSYAGVSLDGPRGAVQLVSTAARVFIPSRLLMTSLAPGPQTRGVLESSWRSAWLSLNSRRQQVKRHGENQIHHQYKHPDKPR